jgi:SAM-dependent methyltransferase
LPLARRVGPGGSVVGLDLTAPMVAWAERAAAKDGISNLRFVVGDAEDLGEFKDATFDLVISNFGVIFAPDPARAVAEMARVLKPGGRCAFSVWLPRGAVEETWALTASITPPQPEGIPSPHEWGDDGVAERRLAAHFDAVTRTEVQAQCDYATVDIAWQRTKEGRPPFALAYGRLPMEEKLAVEARARELYRKYTQPDGRVRYVREAAIVRGVRREA